MGNALYNRYRRAAMKSYESGKPTAAKKAWSDFISRLTPAEKLKALEWKSKVGTKRKHQVAVLRSKVDELREKFPEFKGVFIFGSFMKGKLSPEDLDILIVTEVPLGTSFGPKLTGYGTVIDTWFNKPEDKTRHYLVRDAIEKTFEAESLAKELGIKPEIRYWHTAYYNEELLLGLARQIIGIGISPAGFLGDPVTKRKIRAAYEEALKKGARKKSPPFPKIFEE